MPSLRRSAAALAAAATTALAAAAPVSANTAGTTHYPDLQTVIPTNAFSIVGTGAAREFRYTHLVYNAGPGPFQVKPEYSDASGNYQGRQQFFTHDAGGNWSLVSQRRVPDAFVYHAAHGHFHFPLASFGLYAVAGDGGSGAPIALSPKNGFCIANSYIYDRTVPHSGAYVGDPMASCSDPLAMRGMSVGAVDEYDYRDPGQAIPFAGVPDGTYWFRAMSDPNNDIQEVDESNNEMDVKVTIANGTVTAGQVRYPDTTPPAVTLASPATGTRLTGNTTLVANAADGQRVEFLVDGAAVGSSPDTTGPYRLAWDSTTVVDGEHWLSARTVDAQGRTNTSEVAAIQVASVTPPPTSDALAIDGAVSADGGGTVTTAPLSTLKSNDVLLAFVSSDGPAGSGLQSATVTGGGLQWRLVRRSNARAGTSEVWKAVASGPLTGLQATSTQQVNGFHQSLHLVAFANSSGVGSAVAAAAAGGAPSATLTTTQSGAWVWGVGNDWDAAIPRTPAAGQVLQHQWVDNGVGDTFWMQSLAAKTPTAGSSVTLSDTAPTSNQWNMVAVEVLSGGPFTPPTGDTSPPLVKLTEPQPNATVKGIIQVGATASDDTGVAKVQFKLDGQSLGAPVTAPPFAASWDTRTVSQGQHTISAEAYDAAGNLGTTAGTLVTVDNSGPAPGAITIDAAVNRRARSTLTSPAITTASAGEQLLAFVSLDGPDAASAQSATVSGGGLTWTLVKRSNSQAGVSEIWSARANTVLTNAVITATPLRSGYDGMLHVIAFRGAQATGVAGASGSPSGAPDIYLPGVNPGSWVFAVGNDWDRAVARTPVSGQVLQNQWIDTGAGDTFWVQSTAAPSAALGLVTIHDNAPTNDRWNYAAVELVAAPAPAAPAISAYAARVGFARSTSALASQSGHSSLVSGLCPLGAATGLPPVSDVIGAARRDSALRRAGRQAVSRANRARFTRNHPRAPRR
jgi:hypothetical protein